MDAGKLDKPIKILTYSEGSWVVTRHSWATVSHKDKTSLFSQIGIGARWVEFIIRKQDITLHQAISWNGNHCFLTSITEEEKRYLRVTAAIVEITSCTATPYRSNITISFQAVLTEKYMGHSQSDPQMIVDITYVLVTPKAVSLESGHLVRIGGKAYHLVLCHTTDPWKNEYELIRKEEP